MGANDFCDISKRLAEMLLLCLRVAAILEAGSDEDDRKSSTWSWT